MFNKITSCFRNIIEKIENQNISFWNIVLIIYLASFFRAFLEGYANSLNKDRLTSFIDTFFHYPLWFLGVFLSINILLVVLTREDIKKVSKLWVYFSFVILVPIVLDLVINKGQSVPYTFILGSFFDLVKSFFTYTFYSANDPTPWGIKIEVILAACFVGFYVFYKTKHLIKTVFGILILPVIVFVFAIFPSLLYFSYSSINSNIPNANVETIKNFYTEDFLNSNSFKKTTVFGTQSNIFLLGQKRNNNQSILIAIYMLIISCVLLCWNFYLYSKRKFWAVFKNFRFLRIIYYTIIIGFGLVLATLFYEISILKTLTDLSLLLATFLGLGFAGLYAVWENDEYDIQIDQISNSNRPIPKQELNIAEWNILKYLFLFISINFAFLSGYYVFIFTLLFIGIYHIYSVPPLRFKRIPVLSSGLIAFNTLIIAMVGFFSGIENLRVFPLKYALFIFLLFFFIENIKNIKDIEGDKKNGIKTIPVLLGEEMSKKVFGVISFLACLVAVTFLYFHPLTVLTAIIFGFILYIVINQKNYQEKYVFLTYFAFVLVFILEILVLI